MSGFKRIKKIFKGVLCSKEGSIGVGSLIIFIAMVIVAGVAASVLIQTMNSLQQQALSTSQESLRDVANGLKITHISGYSNGTKITQLAFFISPVAGSTGIDLTYTTMLLSDTNNQVILSYISTCYSEDTSSGLFNSINSSNLSSSTYGVIVIRDTDDSCTSSTPIINDDDLVVILVNTSKCFNGLNTRTKIQGRIIPEEGVAATFMFTTPSAYVNTIIDLQ